MDSKDIDWLPQHKFLITVVVSFIPLVLGLVSLHAHLQAVAAWLSEAIIIQIGQNQLEKMYLK